MHRPRSLITLITDFGLDDPYVGVMKGVIGGINPAVRLVDLCHGIPRQDILAAAFVLKTSYSFFPAGAIHVVVVDPGVGSARAIVAVRTESYLFLAPNNGVLSPALDQEAVVEAVAVNNPAYRLSAVSRTFHGRDIIAPAAAHLARGVPLARLGPPITVERFAWPCLEVKDGCIHAQILYIDRFGNAITNVPEGQWDSCIGSRPFCLEAGGLRLAALAQSYSEVPAGQPLAIFGSSGYLELAVNGGHAGRDLGLEKGTTVRVTVGSLE